MSENLEPGLGNDFSRSQVPEGETYSGLHIALVVIGGTIGIPAFLMASNIGAAIGLADAIKAFVLGCVVLGVLGSLTALSGLKSRCSAYMLTQFAFGRKGAALANLAIALSLIGWYGVISNMFGQAANQAVVALTGWHLPIQAYVLAGSLMMIWVTVKGFKGLDRLALALVPIMAIFLSYAAWLALPEVVDWQSGDNNLTFSVAVSSVIGSYIAGVSIQPDYSRFARNKRHAIGSAFFALGISFPVVLTLAALPSIAFGEPDLIKVMIAVGIGLPAFLLLVLASWSSNVLCLYSSGLSLATIFTGQSTRNLVIAVGIIGTAIAFSNATDYLINFLILLGITIPPIAAIYAIDALALRKEHDLSALEEEPAINIPALIAWLLGTATGIATDRDVFTVTDFAAIDTILVAGIVYYCTESARRRFSRTPVRS